MKKENLLVMGIFVLVVVGAFALMGGFNGPAEGQEEFVPQRMTIPIKTENGKQITLESFKGKTVILHFWATWCPPCKTEIPDLNKYYQKIKNRDDLILLAVSLDKGGFGDVASFAQKTPMEFDHYWDYSEKLAQSFNVITIPTTYVIDAQGSLRAELNGPQQWGSASFRKQIENLTGS